MKYGKAIAIIRGIKGLSKQNFAEAVGLSKSYVTRVEKGERNLAESKVHQIAKKLDIPVRMIFLLARNNSDATTKTAQEIGELMLKLLVEEDDKAKRIKQLKKTI